MEENAKNILEKAFFRVFQCFIYAVFYSVSVFLGAYFGGGNGKKLYLCNRKNKVRGSKPELSIEPQSCRLASKNGGVDDKDDDE